MTPTCLTCKTAALRYPSMLDNDKVLKGMAAAGAINCTISPHAASFHDITHTCEKYTPAIAAIVTSRLAWAKQRGFAITEITKGTA